MGDPEENEMGWTVGWGSKRELVDHLIANAKGSNCELVKHSIVGNNLWMLLKLKDGGQKFVLLNKLQAYRRDIGGYEWGYKDIDESCGPCEVNCPLGLIEEADEPRGYYAADWREQVRAYHAARRKPSKGWLDGLKCGDEFLYNGERVMFLYWYENKRGQRRLAGMPLRGGTYRYPISRIRPIEQAD